MKNKHKKIRTLEKPLSKNYKYYGRYYQEFIDKTKEGLTELNSVRFLEWYCRTRKIGQSGKDNCRKAIIHINKLTLFREKLLHLEIYFRQALKIYKIQRKTKTVMPNDVPTPEDLKLAKENSRIKVNLFIDFVSTTCLRLGEAINIKLSQCRYDKISQGYSIKFVRKGGYEFETWIPKELYDRIIIEYASTVWLFQSPFTEKSHLTAGTAQKWLRDASKFTTRPIRPHLIRHKSINEIIEENPGIPLYKLCDAFGHSEATLKAYYLNKDKVDVTAINKNHYKNLKESERTINQ